MEPTVDTPTRLPTLTPRTLLSVLLVLLLSLLLSGVLEYLRLQQRAEAQASEISRAFGRSSAVLIQPLVLADDRISLNYLLNELAAQPLINGLRLTAPDRTLIALAGESHGRMHTLELVQGEVPIGQLTVWGDPTRFSQPLQQQLLEIAALTGLSLALAGLLLVLSLRRQARAPASPPAEPSFAEVKAAFEQSGDRDRIPDFSFETPPAAEPSPRPFTPPAAAEPVAEPVAEADATPDTAAQQTAAEAPAPADAEPEPQRLDTGELVSLLKPPRDRDAMPRFTPRPPAADTEDSDEAMVPDLGSARAEEDDFAIDELGPADVPPAAERSETPPSPFRIDDEEQLGLYTFEQELELMLTPEEAGYLLLIDTRSAHSDNVDEEEREQLLRHYRLLANSAARIYSGSIEALKDGNLRILFTAGDDKDSHGVNAVCCALLFTRLYKQYNQQQIRAFQPVMNLHMALVRGAADRIERMQEEAHFLTRTTQSNELISHTALTEAPQLKAVLLQQADIRREDEDKVLILGINAAYQTLLEKQARHLLSKLNERNAGSSAG